MDEEKPDRIAGIVRIKIKRFLTVLAIMIAFPGAVYVVQVYF